MSQSILKWIVPYVLINAVQYQVVKDSLNYSSPFVFMAFRYLLAALILLLVFRKLVVSRNSIISAALVSSSSLCWAIGLQYVSIGDSAVLTYTGPLFAIPLAILLLRERPRAKEVVGAVIGFAGVAIYSVTLSHGSLLLGAVLTIFNAIFWAGFTIFLRMMRGYDPAGVVTSQFLFGSVPFLVGSLFYPSVAFTSGFFLDLAYAAVLSGIVTFALLNAMLSVEKVGKVTTMSYAIPASTIALQSMLTLQLPAVTSIAGATLMFIGIYISYAQPQLFVPRAGVRGGGATAEPQVNS